VYEFWPGSATLQWLPRPAGLPATTNGRMSAMPAGSFELYVHSYGGKDCAELQCARLNGAPISVGRSPGCHLSLDDPERLISRSHLSAWVDPQGRTQLRNTSSTSPAFIDGQELAPGGSRSVVPGQSIVVGRYLLGLRMAVEEPVASASFGYADDMSQPLPFSPIPAEFDVFASTPPATSASGGTDAEFSLDEFSPDRHAAAQLFDALPDFDARGPSDSFSLASLSNVAPDRATRSIGDLILSNESIPALDPLLGDSAPHSGEIDSLFSLPTLSTPASLDLDLLAQVGGTSGSEPFRGADLSNVAVLASSGVLPDVLAGVSDVPSIRDADLDSSASARRALSPSVLGMDVPESTGLMELLAAPSGPPPQAVMPAAIMPATNALPPRPAVAPAQLGDAAPLRPAPSSSASSDALRDAFARGCGLPADRLGAFDEASVEALGRVVAALVGGTLQLIHARSSTKHEMRANVTIIASSGNNPLKFAPDAQAALMQLLGRGLPGFMAPEAAVVDAFEDLCAHQVGLLSASRSAMYAVASRLSPERIEQSTGGARGMGSMLPGARKARLWDHFVDQHGALLGEAREEFDAVFQHAFVRAYEGEVQRLQSGESA
jgi:predicted component of type VI protein secretion system